ncbi:MAG: PepSY domain-containing protein, partial [Gemmatimonadetes bacterium]|nr:PepSY domain-containing protein [Gemmatimonadota bacterium]
HRRPALALAPVIPDLLDSGDILPSRPARTRANAVVDVARITQALANPAVPRNATAFEVSPDGRTVVAGSPDAPPVAIDVGTLAQVPLPAEDAPDLFEVAARVHRNLWFGLGGLVTLATFALLVLAALGPLLGPYRRPRTALTWHIALGWLSWPLIVFLPLTAVLIVVPIGRPPGFAREVAPVPLVEALTHAAPQVDLTHLRFAQVMPGGGLFIVTEGASGPERRIVMGARVYDFGGRFVQVMRDLHAGDVAGPWGRVLVLASALVLLALMGTGLVSWTRRRRTSAARRASGDGATEAEDAPQLVGTA